MQKRHITSQEKIPEAMPLTKILRKEKITLITDSTALPRGNPNAVRIISDIP